MAMALAEKWREAKAHHAFWEQKARETGFLLGKALEEMSGDRRRLVLDTLADVEYVPAKPIKRLDVERLAGRCAARSADRWGSEPPAVLAARCWEQAALIFGVTESVTPRVGHTRAFGVAVDECQRTDGWRSATVRPKPGKIASHDEAPVGRGRGDDGRVRGDAGRDRLAGE